MGDVAGERRGLQARHRCDQQGRRRSGVEGCPPGGRVACVHGGIAGRRGAGLSGHEGVREFFRDFSEHFDELHWESGHPRPAATESSLSAPSERGAEGAALEVETPLGACDRYENGNVTRVSELPVSRARPSKPPGCRSRRCRRRTWRDCGAATKHLIPPVTSTQRLPTPISSGTCRLPRLARAADLPRARGREAIHRRRWTSAWDDWELEVEDYIDAGDTVVVIVRQRGRSKSTGVLVEMRFGQVWTTRGGEGNPDADVREPGRSPRSRRAVGVGDVAGERGDRSTAH